MVKRRNRKKQSVPFKDRLLHFAHELREEASKLPPCEQRDNLLKRAGSADIAVEIDEWACSTELHLVRSA
jgi:hypothetical protein